MGKPDPTKRAPNHKMTRSRAAPILSASIKTQVCRARAVIHRKIRVVRRAAAISKSRASGPPAKGLALRAPSGALKGHTSETGASLHIKSAFVLRAAAPKCGARFLSGRGDRREESED